jgi:broad specificity phosphatase PhoE
MKQVVKLTESDLNRIINKVIYEEKKFQYFDEMEQFDSQEKAKEFIKELKLELDRPYLDRFESWDKKRKMRKPTLEEIIKSVKRVINRYEKK